MSNIDLEDPFAGITVCEIHTHGMEEGCEFCEAEFGAKKQIVETLSSQIQTDVAGLQAGGMGFPENFVTNMRLELLIESILADRNRIHFECEIARRMSLAVIDAKKQLTRAMLTAPGPMGGPMGGKAPNLSVLRGK